MRQRVHQEIFFISCLLFAFFLPVYPRIIPAIITLMAINWLISGIYLEKFPKILKEKWRFMTLSFASLYLLYLLGMLYSSNLNYGWFDLEVKLSLFVFPVIFATSDLNIFTTSRTRLLYWTFITGCVAGSFILLGHASTVNLRSGIPDPFYYTNLAWYFHSSYLAMYYTFGVGISLYYLSDNFLKWPVIKIIGLSFIILYLEALIFLLSSKAGLITLAAMQILFVVLLLFRKDGLTRTILVFSIMVTVFFAFSMVFPFAFTRISKADSMISSSKTIQTNLEDGTVARVEIWKVSIGLIKQHFMFGVGTGDVKDVYMEAYQQKKLLPIIKKKLNAHNQYFQTFVTLGVIGFSLLVLFLLLPGYLSLKKGNYLYTLFLLIFAINILFESMLETQAGVVFYAFFNVFLFSRGGGNNSRICES
jgi:O-antigen ligase